MMERSILPLSWANAMIVRWYVIYSIAKFHWKYVNSFMDAPNGCFRQSETAELNLFRSLSWFRFVARFECHLTAESSFAYDASDWLYNGGFEEVAGIIIANCDIVLPIQLIAIILLLFSISYEIGRFLPPLRNATNTCAARRKYVKSLLARFV